MVIMKHISIKAFILMLGFSLSASIVAVNAQETGDNVVAGLVTSIEEIIVTANKREQLLNEVAMAITAITGAEIAERGIDTIQDLSFAVPGLTMREDGPGSYTIFLRGVANAHGVDGLTGVYQDEINMVLTGSDVLPTRALDLARIEVLKGPQGTLYGQGAVGGAIRYITNDPNLEKFERRFEAEVFSVDSGSNGTNFTAIVNVPLSEGKFAIRLAANFKNDGGWQDQPAAGIENGNGDDLRNIRLKALWKPSEKLEVLGTFISYRAEYQLGQGYENPDRTVYVAIDPAKELVPKIWDYELSNLTLSYDLGFAELTSSTSYADMDHRYPMSYFGSEQTTYGGVLSGNDDRLNPGDQFAQELRLTSSGDGPFQWTVGAFYRDMERSLHATYEYGWGSYVSPTLFYYKARTSKTTSVFADASYQVTESLKIGAGVRNFDDDVTQTGGFAPDQVFQEDSFDSTDPRFYLSYAISDNANVYASAASGFRSGGFNNPGQPTYDPEELWSYELGVKGNFLDGALYFDLAGYSTKYDDMLRRGLVFVGAEAGFLSIISNVGKAEIKGIEASFVLKASDSFTLSGSAASINADITEVNADSAANIAGDLIDYVPKLSYTLSGVYDFSWSNNKPGYVRVTYSYRDKLPYIDRTSFPAENLPQFSDRIGMWDARIGFTIDNVNVEVYAQNLTNENKYIDPYGGWNNANRTRPQAIGIKVGVDF